MLFGVSFLLLFVCRQSVKAAAERRGLVRRAWAKRVRDHEARKAALAAAYDNPTATPGQKRALEAQVRDSDA